MLFCHLKLEEKYNNLLLSMLFHISTLGCKVNQHESDILAAALRTRGWQVVEDGQVADVCIVNTCTVTQKASMQSRQMIRQLQRRHPGTIIIVTGCYAQVAPEEIEGIDGVHAIVGHRRKSALPDLIIQAAQDADAAPRCSVENLDATIPFADPPVTAPGGRTRPFLKIQDGCNSFCTYCIVPYARGRSRSMRPERVLHHLGQLGALLASVQVLSHRARNLLLELILEIEAEKLADVGALEHQALPSARPPVGGTARIWTRRRTDVASSSRARLRRDLTVP